MYLFVSIDCTLCINTRGHSIGFCSTATSEQVQVTAYFTFVLSAISFEAHNSYENGSTYGFFNLFLLKKVPPCLLKSMCLLKHL